LTSPRAFSRSTASETCGGVQRWERKLRGFGLDAQLFAGHAVTPYRMAGKHDANDAAALCEAAGRSHMRFVSEQQALLAMHRLREGYKEGRTHPSLGLPMQETNWTKCSSRSVIV
jgi:transposase